MADGKNRFATQERLLELIAGKLRNLGRSLRWVERKLKVSHGTLPNLLNGRTALRFEHLDLFAELFATTPAKLLAEAEGESTLIARIKLQEKLAPELKRLQTWAIDLQSEIRREGGAEEGVRTAMGTILESLIHQHLAGAIQAAEEAAGLPAQESRSSGGQPSPEPAKFQPQKMRSDPQKD